MGLFSKFSKKPEEPQTHEEPGMSRSLNNDVVNKEFAGREPGFNQPKNPLNSTTQILRTSPAETQNQPAFSESKSETSFLSSGPRGDTAKPPVPPASPSQEVPLSAPKEFIPTPRKVFPEQKPSKETSEQINSSQEQYRQIKRIRARRRLIGAVMLLALVVVTVPFLFDKEPPPPTVTIPLRIPSQNSVDVASIQVPGSSAAVNSAVVPSSQDNAARPAPATDAATAKPASSKQNPPAQASKKDEKTPQKADKSQQKPEKSEAKKQDAKKDQPKAKSQETAKPAVAAKGSYYVQVAAISNEARAKELLKKIQGAGIPGYIEPVAVKNGKIWRVRAGNFPTSKAAEDARARVGLLGLTGKVGQIK
ncbi:SPOR domain-containing protein [Turicimonas muris]|uniref:SPOR domain-containing protein n=3 Tax=Turicimonas muris TaxID=1796652 RepID=UPI0025B77A49|nr:SPOR domain-containing protein [Turicimonas muris]